MSTRYRWDDFVLDLDSYRLERDGKALPLEPKAFNLLALVIQRPGHVFTKQEIFDTLWAGTAVTDHALTRVVAQLRRVLGDEAREARYLETVPTRGYRWKKVVDAAAHEAPGTRHEALAAAAVLALIALAFLAWAQRFPATTALALADNDPAWPVQMTTYAGVDVHPALSPQGDAIAFASDRSGALEIYVRALGGGSAETPLTSDGAQNVQPAWSPDGKFIVYHSYQHGGIWVMPARGGTPRQIVASGSRPAWSPAGDRIAFQTGEHGELAPNGYSAQVGSTIWIVNRDGTGARALTRATTPIGGHSSPAWSHDGRFIAFTVFDAGAQNGVWLVAIESGDTVPLHLGDSLYDPVFARDDSSIYVAGAESLIVRLPFDPAKGRLKGPRELIPVPGAPGVRGLTLSADGKRLAFAGLALDSQIWSLTIGEDGAAAGPATAVTNGTSRRNSLPVLSPDGGKIAYMSVRQGELPNVWVMDADGGNPIQLTSDETADHKPSWFPDGLRVGYLSKRGAMGGFWSVDIATRREELVVDLAAAQRAPEVEGRLAEFQLSPDMSRIAFSLIAPPQGRRVLYVSGSKRFEPRRIASPAVSAGYPAWSPDGTTLAVEIQDGGSTQAGVIDLSTGALKQLTHLKGQTWVRSWSPDGTRIAVAAQRGGLWSLRWIDVRNGREAAFAPPEPPRVYVRYPEWSAQGTRVLFERGEVRGNIWTIAID